MSDRKTILHSSERLASTVSVRSESTFGLTLGEVRRFVAAADERQIPDDVDVYFEDLRKSNVRVDEWTAQRMMVRSEREPGDGE